MLGPTYSSDDIFIPPHFGGLNTPNSRGLDGTQSNQLILVDVPSMTGAQVHDGFRHLHDMPTAPDIYADQLGEIGGGYTPCLPERPPMVPLCLPDRPSRLPHCPRRDWPSSYRERQREGSADIGDVGHTKDGVLLDTRAILADSQRGVLQSRQISTLSAEVGTPRYALRNTTFFRKLKHDF